MMTARIDKRLDDLTQALIKTGKIADPFKGYCVLFERENKPGYYTDHAMPTDQDREYTPQEVDALGAESYKLILFTYTADINEDDHERNQ